MTAVAAKYYRSMDHSIETMKATPYAGARIGPIARQLPALH